MTDAETNTETATPTDAATSPTGGESGGKSGGGSGGTWFSVHPTPIGDALVVVAGAGLVSLQLIDGDPAAALGDMAFSSTGLALRASPRHDPGATASVTAELDAYFAGDLRHFETPIDWRLAGGGFALAALKAITSVPYGEVASYAEIAALAGSARAHRAVGSACARTPISIVVPAHRVVRADGSIGDYGGHPERKRFLLELEGSLMSVRV